MKQFNLEEYLRLKGEGEEPRVVTRDGKSARIICTDRKINDYPIIDLVNCDDTEYIYRYADDGTYDGNPSKDLFFAPTKHEGWINLYKNNKGYDIGALYATEDEAKANASHINTLIATVKIEWKE